MYYFRKVIFFNIFIFQISNNALTVTVLKVIFDLLQKYGFEFFSLVDIDVGMLIIVKYSNHITFKVFFL